MRTQIGTYRPSQYLAAWAVHAFTASAAAFGVLTLAMTYQHNYVMAFWFMALAVFVDAVDGTLARQVGVKEILPNIDGALLDNIVDYLNYAITPCFFLFVKSDMLPDIVRLPVILCITISSAYQFCQSDAKTPDHFFKGFPCYWNIALFYLFILNTSPVFNAAFLCFLGFMIFVPIKYVYPSRLDYLTNSRILKMFMHIASTLYGLSSAYLLVTYPKITSSALFVSLGYVALYLMLSVYRTFYPLPAKIIDKE